MKEVIDAPEIVIFPYGTKIARRQLWPRLTVFWSVLRNNRRYGFTVREGSTPCSK